MKVLIVDDNTDKMGEIRNVIASTHIVADHQIYTSVDVADATRKLRSNNFDFVIIDLNLAKNIGENTVKNMGKDLIDTINGQRKIYKPHTVLILSEFEESINSYEQEDSSIYESILFNTQSNHWKKTLIKRLNSCKRYLAFHTKKKDKIDLAFITAVDVEFEAVKSLFDKWVVVEQEEVNGVFYTCTYEKDGITYKLLLTQIKEMGIGAASVGTSSIFRLFHPKYIAMTGIAAGVSNEYGYGDIIVPDSVWNYSSGKLKKDDEALILHPDSNSLNTDGRSFSILHGRDNREVLNTIYSDFKGQKPTTHLNVINGKMACGSAVVTATEIIADQITAHSRKTSGIDMESYGVLLAANQEVDPPKVIIAKAISDFADSQKGDEFQKYAAFSSASYIKSMIPQLILKGND